MYENQCDSVQRWHQHVNVNGGSSIQRGSGANERASFKSWAQQTEESYQLQLALALRVASQAASAGDSNFLDFNSDADRAVGSFSDTSEAVSHRFWVNGSLSYIDRIPDGFYIIHGIDPYAWTLSADQQVNGRIPSFESLKEVDHRDDSSMKVILIDKQRDANLKELQNLVLSLPTDLVSKKDAVYQLASLVCDRMGGAAFADEGIYKQWTDCTEVMKECLGSIVLPIGSLSVGLCVHRALLFKVLADLINIPCRIAKGCKYCRSEDASSCLVQFGPDREYLVDLFWDPGTLSQPDSSLNGRSSTLISSPLCHPKFKPPKTAASMRTLARLFFFDCQSLKIAFDDDFSDFETHEDRKSGAVPPFRQEEGNSTLVVPNAKSYSPSELRRDPYLEVEDFDIPWSELVLKEKIGSGSFGTVHRADWHGSEVAVKILMEQDFHAERFKEFLGEVAIMKRLRHPNIVLFMGAVTQPPKLSIVTEYLSRGSLFKLLQMPNARLILDERRRLSMAYDVAHGMNYLHQLRPPIVHRDLKSPNLLVDSTYTVKICDFGLSRSKANTYLSSKTAAGTPEWMAPEVLRDEPSNEKSDVYSFGVVLWELVTLQQPWRHLNPPQVVAAVGFKGKRLEIPPNGNPAVASLIELCLSNEPSRRPSFSYIMECLRELIRNCLSEELHAHSM